MQVNSSSGDVARTESVQRPGSAGNAAAAAESAPAPRADQVDISDAARALAGDTEAAAGDVDPRRADEIRAKILSGAYDSLAAADQVARAILRSGDI